MDEFARQVFDLRSMQHSLYVFTVVVWGWGFLFMSSFGNIPPALIFLLPAVGALPLLIFVLRFATHLRGLSGPSPFANKRMFWFYSGVVALTVIGYVVIARVTQALHHPQYIVPGATILVGLHFLALIPIFHQKRYYLTTLVFCFAALLPVLFVPTDFMLGSLHVISGWQLVTSPICWLWLWGQAIYVLTHGARLLRQAKAGNVSQPSAVVP
jgi:hypothetical protein